MEFKDTSLICKNGHIINESMKKFPKYNEKYCSKCGAEAIYKCDKCNQEIRGAMYFEDTGLIKNIDELPAYCHNCGSAYEWTRIKIEALNDLIELDDELNQEEKDALKQSGIEISTENPKNKVAVLKAKKILCKITSDIKNEIKDALVEVASKTAVEVMKSQGML